MLTNLLSKFVNPYFAKVNAFMDGKKTITAALIIGLPAMACLIEALSSQPLNLDRLSEIIHGDCVKQLGEAMAIIGFRSAMKK